MDNLEIDRILRATLSENPSPEFVARVRTTLAEAPRPSVVAGWLKPAAAVACAAVLAIAVWLPRENAQLKLSPTEDELSPTEDELSPTEDELRPAEDELRPTEDELRPTEDELRPTEDELRPTEDRADEKVGREARSRETCGRANARERRHDAA